MNVKIKEIAKLINDKIETDELTNSSYISTENMLQNFGGITIAANVPSGKCSSFNKNDILLSNIRPYFKKTWFATFSGGCSNDVIVIRASENICLSKYLFYILNTNDFVNTYVASCKGTKMPRGNKDVLLDWEIDLPNIKVQQHIVNTISSLLLKSF